VFVKICGITTEEDALLAVAMGADAVGFVFAPSTRQVAAAHVRDIVRRLPPDVLTVGVFRDECPQRVVDVVQRPACGPPSCTVTRRPRTPSTCGPGSTVIKAFPPAPTRPLDRVDDWGPTSMLIDSKAPGSGQVFDWALAEGAPRVGRVLLAGGLTPDNVADAIAQVQPWGVDVASGVERTCRGRRIPGRSARSSNAKRARRRPPLPPPPSRARPRPTTPPAPSTLSALRLAGGRMTDP
jgi:phosphoribosylanthranilate isomerase